MVVSLQLRESQLIECLIAQFSRNVTDEVDLCGPFLCSQELGSDEIRHQCRNSAESTRMFSGPVGDTAKDIALTK